jgi:hypothetical protein
MFHNFILNLYYQSPNLQEEEKKKRKMYLYKPVPNVVWKEIQKFRKEKAARDKARSISKKKMKRSQAKIRKKEQPFVCNVMHI